jgi:5-methylcytosine-specific restriction endonuclease McrA
VAGPAVLRDAVAAWRARRRADAPARRNRARGTHCYYCGAPFHETGPRQRTVDHRLPRSQAGPNRLVNLVFACWACNQRKADLPEAEFLSSEWLALRRRELDTRRPDTT